MNNGVIMDAECAKPLNRLAREQMKHRLLCDIRTDLVVCEIEGIDPREYINELIELLQKLGKQHEKAKDFNQ